MSKRLKEVLANRLHISFLETIENDPCDFVGTMRITVREQQEDGTPWLHETTRHVKLCDSQDVCREYDIPIDAQSGTGSVVVEYVEGVQLALVQVDENGQQMLHEDEYAITYKLDGEESEMDYINFVFDERSSETREVEIINRRIPLTSLHIEKVVLDRDGCRMPIDPQWEFPIRIVDMRGCEQCFTLNVENQFHIVIEQLRVGNRYTIEEMPQRGFSVSYSFNDVANVDNVFEMTQGENHLQIINAQSDTTSITIEKYIRSTCGELCRPNRFEEFQVRIIAWNQDRIIRLNERNNFCVTLFDMEPGYYDITEISDNASYEVSYIVNGRKETNYANLELNSCEEASVLIINTDPDNTCNPQQESPLRICKFIRRCDGCITQPDKKDSFKVMLCGCGRNDTFLLNANNNFCVDVADLCEGCYEVVECSDKDYMTTYRVNDGPERTSAIVDIMCGGCNSVAIINEERNRGSVSICKYVRNANGDLVKPQKDECFQVSLSSYFCKRDFELNVDNDWCMSFCDLRFGGYEVRECSDSEYQVQYQVNGGKECSSARFVIDDCCDNEVKIINSVRTCSSGILKICKYEETNSQELVKPSQDEEFCVEVSGPCFCENYTLRSSNNWCILLEGLQPGEYQIRECDCENYDVSYLVNREVMEEAFVYLGTCNQEVLIINHRKHSGRLKLYTLIRDCDKTTRLPQSKEAFDVLVEGVDTCVHTTLKASNGWCVLLDDLAEGVYRIIQKDTMGYHVSYVINGEESNFAKVTLGLNDISIGIINQVRDCSGMLTVTKYVQQEDGSLVMPCPQDSFTFELKGRGFTHTYHLNERNDFCVYFDDLEEGQYSIRELCEDYDVTYRINGKPVASADVTLGMEDIDVDIINTPRMHGMVCIEKRLRCADRIIMPDPDSCYRILLKGKNCHEIYELHHDNDFCVCLTNLAKQHYEISELEHECKLFDINGSLQDTGYFLYDGEEKHITLINEEDFIGCMEINKQVEDEDGTLRRPQRWERFDVIVESEEYKRKIVLSHENDFCMRLYDLPKGHYEVREANADHVSYIVNELPCESAVVDLDEQDVCVTIINHAIKKGCIEFQGCIDEDGTLLMPKPKDEIAVTVTSKQEEYTLTLQDENEFCDCLCDLKPQAYTVSVQGNYKVRFEIEGQVFEDVVCIELNGEHVCVNVVVSSNKKADITIQKHIQDADGSLQMPKPEEQFQITLLHNGRKQMFELNAKNHWTKVLQQQESGVYEIIEVHGGTDVVYQIDDGEVSKRGYFEVGKDDVTVHVINRQPSRVKLHLEAVVKNCTQDIVSPNASDVFYMDVISQEKKKTFVLNQANHWCQSVEVDRGAYRIMQQTNEAFDEHYYLVDGVQQPSVDIVLKQKDMRITSVNVANCAKGTLEISKVIRDENCGCFKRPDTDMEYEVEVSGPNAFREVLTLSADNKWRVHLQDLAWGMYQVKELGAQDTRYIVNGEMESEKAQLQIANTMNTVKIINETTHHQGSIEICKLLKDEEGCYRYPDVDAMYWIMIKGETHSSRVLLNHANHFYASVRNLEDGWYEVSEESGRDVLYVVNNATPSKRAMVHVQGNANTVNVINPYQTQLGRIDISKYIMSGDLLIRPTSGSFEVMVRGNGEEKTFTLTSENDFRASVKNLRPGTYEVIELHGERVSYIINRTQHLDEAIIKVAGNQTSVQVVNHEREHGSITLAKYVREHGELIRPTKGEYVFHISKPNFNQLVTLNEENGWMATLEHLEDGQYVIAETTTSDKVSFIVNGGSECDYGIVEVAGNSNTVQIINTRKQPGGSILMEKFIRRNHALVKPSNDFQITMHVSKPGFNQNFILNKENNWMIRLDHLENGIYVIDEVDAQDDVSFIINGGSEVARAVVTVRNNVNTVNIIDAQPKETGSIRIEKYVRNLTSGELELPPASFSIRVHVSKPGYNEVFTLNAANRFAITLSNLMDGTYVIDEVDTNDEVSFIVNGGSEVRHGIVRVQGNRNLVLMINTSNTSTLGSLTINKVVRNAQGQLVVPNDHERFDVDIISDVYERRFILDKDNNWQIHVNDLPRGRYQVIEQLAKNYQVSYIVDNEEESEQAAFDVDGTMHTVKILNTRASILSTLEITKFIRQANGTLVRPADGDEYVVEVSNASFQQQLLLNGGNAFTYTLRDLSEGIYNIREIDQDAYRVTYRVNGGTETDSAAVTITPGKRHIVEVINERTINQNTIEVFKYMLDNEDNYLPPASGQVFRFEIIGENIRDSYELNEANSWHRSLTQYPSGMYEIREIGSPYPVQYLVNSAELLDEARFEATAQRTNIIGIINRLPNVQNGTMTLTKRLRQKDGSLVLPTTQSFIIRVSGNDFERMVTLDKENGFSERLENLAYQSYTIEEMSSPYAVSYIIDDGKETSTASVDINSDATRTITIINTRNDLFYDVGSELDDLTIVIQ